MCLKTTANLCTSLVCFWDKVSVCIFGCSETHSVDQVPIELRDPLATAGIKGIHIHHHADFFFWYVCNWDDKLAFFFFKHSTCITLIILPIHIIFILGQSLDSQTSIQDMYYVLYSWNYLIFVLRILKKFLLTMLIV